MIFIRAREKWFVFRSDREWRGVTLCKFGWFIRTPAHDRDDVIHGYVCGGWTDHGKPIPCAGFL